MRKVIVVEPEDPRNTGFIARLAANFGFSLRLVQPDFNLREARETANRAQQKLRDARISESLSAALEDVEHAVGTKEGEKPLSEMDLEPAYSVVIGPESTGLRDEHLELRDSVAGIQTEDYGSMNQSHAAGVAMYMVSIS